MTTRNINLKPELMYSDNGDMFIQITHHEWSEKKLVPYFEIPNEFYKWVAEVVPQMTKDLFKKRRDSQKKIRRRFKK